MKKHISTLLSLLLLLSLLAGCTAASTSPSAPPSAASQTSQSTAPAPSTGEVRKVGFVTFGLGGDFFQQLADSFVTKMTEAGWDADYTDGKFDPTTQIEAFENYIAMGVDAIVIWSVAPEAMNTVVEQAMDKGIKVIAFVAPTEKYDVLMVADNEDLAASCAKLAAQWIDKTYADQEDHSVPVAVFTDRTAETGVVQGDVLLKIEDYSKKAKLAMEVECSAEDVDTGMAKAETLYTSNPEIQIFLTAHNGLALGINNYYTSISSPVTDYKNMGIFTINGDKAVAELIQASAQNESPLRGMVLTGSVDLTAEEIRDAVEGAMDGSLAPGHIQEAQTIFVNADTVEEYLQTGFVTTLSKEDFS